MLYSSTRGGVSGLSFEEALFSGYATDGGLLIPARIPFLSKDILEEWRTHPKFCYKEIVKRVVRLFVSESEISGDELDLCVGKPYSTFGIGETIGFRQIKNATGNVVNIVELFHGPTGSFKDLSLSLIGQLMNLFLEKRKKHIILLVGTTGDTGSAAMNAVRGSNSIDIIGLYPKGRISTIQEWHMRSITDSNVHLFEVEGTSDELDVPIKECFPSEGLACVNAINWARIMIQIAHHVFVYLKDGGNEILVFIPTGAAGNLTAAVFAHKMGIPIQIRVATNRNDCVDVLISQGILELDRDVVLSAANAMDVGHPYNVERILYLFSNAKTVKGIMETGGKVQIPHDVLSRMRAVILTSVSVTDEEIYDTVKQSWANNQYLICPHTATALACYEQTVGTTFQTTSEPRAYVYSTAKHYKFPETAEKVGIDLDEWNRGSSFAWLETGEKRQSEEMKLGEDWFQILQHKIGSIQSKY